MRQRLIIAFKRIVGVDFSSKISLVLTKTFDVSTTATKRRILTDFVEKEKINSMLEHIRSSEYFNLIWIMTLENKKGKKITV